jgi:hypothetical protein
MAHLEAEMARFEAELAGSTSSQVDLARLFQQQDISPCDRVSSTVSDLTLGLAASHAMVVELVLNV